MPDATTAVLFPGQGSQTPDMRDRVEEIRPDLLDLAIEAVGADPFARIEDGTRFQQPAIFCASLAGWERVVTTESSMLAGHSLGEITALVASGAIGEVDGLRLVAARGRLMQEAAEANGGGMIAVRAGREQIESLLAATGVSLANDNAPRQVVLSGPEPALTAAEVRLAAEGTRSMRLRVAGAFHSPGMDSAVAAFRAAVSTVAFAPPQIPVVSCITAEPVTDPAATLVAGLTSPVRWVETLHALRRLGAERFVETGPGTVLAGLVRRTLPQMEAVGG